MKAKQRSLIADFKHPESDLFLVSFVFDTALLLLSLYPSRAGIWLFPPSLLAPSLSVSDVA